MTTPTPTPTEPPQPDPPPTPPAEPPDDPDDADLSEREQRYKREATSRRRELRAAQAVTDELRKELEALRAERETETDKRVREAVDQAVGDTRAHYERELLEHVAIAQAAGRFKRPDVVVRLIPLDDIAHEDDRDARRARIDEELDRLAEDMPELALPVANGTVPASLVTQGARGPGATPKGDDPDAWLRKLAGR